MNRGIYHASTSGTDPGKTKFDGEGQSASARPVRVRTRLASKCVSEVPVLHGKGAVYQVRQVWYTDGWDGGG